jgi:hypothetical protein
VGINKGVYDEVEMILGALVARPAITRQEFADTMNGVFLTEDGKFSGRNLWNVRDPNDPTAAVTMKADYFRWSRDWDFAKKSAGDDPSRYVYALACNIQDQAPGGYRIDIEASRGDRLVFRKTGDRTGMEMDECTKLACQALGVKKPPTLFERVAERAKSKDPAIGPLYRELDELLVRSDGRKKRSWAETFALDGRRALDPSTEKDSSLHRRLMSLPNEEREDYVYHLTILIANIGGFQKRGMDLLGELSAKYLRSD